MHSIVPSRRSVFQRRAVSVSLTPGGLNAFFFGLNAFCSRLNAFFFRLNALDFGLKVIVRAHRRIGRKTAEVVGPRAQHVVVSSPRLRVTLSNRNVWRGRRAAPAVARLVLRAAPYSSPARAIIDFRARVSSRRPLPVM